jgi:P63C domain
MDDDKDEDKQRAGQIGGAKRAEILPPARRVEIAQKAAIARWGAKLPRATHRGSFKEDFGIDVECYVLDDQLKTAVISQRGMAATLGINATSGAAFPRFLASRSVAGSVGAELREKIENPLKFLGGAGGAEQPPKPIYGFDVTLLIDVCNAIIKAETAGTLRENQRDIARQAHIILSASAKNGIRGLVYALAGYNPTTEEVIAAFKLYVQEEAKKYEPEFPNELYMQWHRLYGLAVPKRGKPWHFKSLTVRHVYFPLAKSNGKILELLKALKSKDGDPKKKLFQFLNVIGARALRIQLGRVLEMAESSRDKFVYENKIAERFGGQKELELLVPTPSVIPPDAEDGDLLEAAAKLAWKPEDDKEAAN